MALVLTQQQGMEGPRGAPHASGLAAKAAACARNPAGNAARRGSSLEGPARVSISSACERSLSVGVCLTESAAAVAAVGFSRGIGARSSSALPTIMTTEVLAQQQQQQQPQPGRSGTGSPPLGGADCSGNVGVVPHLGLPSSRRPRKVVSHEGSVGLAGSGMEPEAEPSASTSALLSPVAANVAAIAATSSTAATTSATVGGEFALTSRTSLSEELEHADAPAERLQSACVAVDPETLNMKVLLLPSEIIRWDDLELIQPISTGSFGEVFLARHQGQEVSVKRCLLGHNGSMTKEQLLNMEREINTYRTLNHPAIVKYIGCVLEHPNLAIVTEYVPNGNLFDLLYMHRMNLPAAIRLKIGRTVTRAIQYMHSCDPVVIHRDLKTQNLVLDAEYNVKLCDFGKTQALWREYLPCDQDTGGSPRYMAPECFMQGIITEKVDIWSLGCCLVEVLGGPLPYEDVPQMAQVLNIMLVERRPPMVPTWFSPIVKPMLANCFEFDQSLRSPIGDVVMALGRLTAEELQKHGMDKRRTR